MALVKCGECGNQVSTEAVACPSCGAKPPKKTSFLTWAVLVFIVLVIIGSMTSEESSTAPAKTDPQAAQRRAEADQRARESSWVERGKEAVLSKLKDPDSAQFNDVYFYRAKGQVPVACGQVNSKNSFGGYGGFLGFISAGKPELTYLEEEVKDFVDLWNKLCTGERET